MGGKDSKVLGYTEIADVKKAYIEAQAGIQFWMALFALTFVLMVAVVIIHFVSCVICDTCTTCTDDPAVITNFSWHDACATGKTDTCVPPILAGLSAPSVGDD